jgi:pyruvate formate lyase activating enzyme
MHDGPGIRTTVFTKGCPLRCLWCHNPETQSTVRELSFDAEKCIRCGACAQACEHGVHEVDETRHTVYRERCANSGKCVSACPKKALKLFGEEWSPEAIVALALRDKAFYDRTNGGLTLSGGEPMSQFLPVKDTLRLAREAGIHTCLDTSGQASTSHYLEVLPFVSLFLWDYKATGEAIHKELTGSDGALIRHNLQTLYDAGAKIRLRCPLVPGLNDQERHLRAIAEISDAMPGLDGVDVMAYHSMGRDKASRVGIEQAGLPHESASEDQIAHWLEALNSYGCRQVTLV